MKFLALSIFLSLFALAVNSRAEYIACDGFQNHDSVHFASLAIDTPSKTLNLSESVNLSEFINYGPSNKVLLAGTYNADTRLSDDQKFVFDISGSIDQSCNDQATYLIFENQNNLFKINIKCDGASASTVYRHYLSCTHY